MVAKKDTQAKTNPMFFGTRIKIDPGAKAIGFTDRELDHVHSQLTASNLGEGLILESVTFREVDDFYNPGDQVVDGNLIFEAITIPQYSRTSKRMAAFTRSMKKHFSGSEDADTGEEITVAEAVIGKPRRSGGFAYVTVQVPFSDGQRISVVFHSPEGSREKITNTDALIAFRWLLNKRDITHVVAPENGQEVSLESVGKRVAQLVLKNNKRFVATQKQAAMEMQELQDLKESVDELDKENATLAEGLAKAEEDGNDLAVQVASTQKQVEKQMSTNAELEADIVELKAQLMARKPEEEEATGEGKGESLDPEYPAGFSWDSKLGKRTVLGPAKGRPEGWLEIKGEDSAFNQLLHEDELAAEINRDTKNFESHKKRLKEEEELDKQEAERQARYEDIGGFTDDMTQLQKANALKALNKQINLASTVTTRKKMIEDLVDLGAETSTRKVDKVKPMSRKTSFRATQEEQDAHERRVKDAGLKTVYSIANPSNDGAFYDITKTEHDYANYLINQKATTKPDSIDGGPDESHEQPQIDTLNAIISGEHNDTPEVLERLLDEAAEELEKQGLMDQYDDLLNQAADVAAKIAIALAA